MSLPDRMLDQVISVRQLVYLAITIGVPYLAIGATWAITQHDHLRHLTGIDQFFSILGEIVAWPVLLIANVDLS